MIVANAKCASAPPTLPDATSSDAPVHDQGQIDALTMLRDVSSDTSEQGVSPDGSDATSPEVLRVLFVGNSYTYVNDLPAMLSGIAQSSGVAPRIETQSVTAGGATLQIHWSNPSVQSAITTTRWNAVVLQGQSVEPLLDPASFNLYADRFGTLLRDQSITPYWFATWARRAGDPVYSVAWSGGTPMQMSTGLESAYLSASQRNGGQLVAVGAAWTRSLSEQPSIVLHMDDGSHPTLAGTYLAACMFYIALTHHPVPDSATVPMLLEPDAARALRDIAVRASNAR